MTAYYCFNCGCVHGWSDHPLIQKVTKHQRWPGEDIWWCPGCNREMRTFDGSFFGQTEKKWIQFDFDPNDPAELMPEFHMEFMFRGQRDYFAGARYRVPRAVKRAMEQAEEHRAQG